MTAVSAHPGSGVPVVVQPPADAAPETAPVAARARWERPALAGLLIVTAVLYLWGLSASGWANSFYSAAVQAGSESWTAFLYGASDAAGSITVDKPPASLWVMALSVRLFGLSSWSILVPQALMGVATVGVLYASVRRAFSAQAALLAGAALALTPVAALMFRFNNPDALLLLLLTGAVAAVLRAVEGPRTTRWMVLAGALVGVAFLTKQLQAFLVLPSLALMFLWAAPVGIGRRVRDSLLGLAAMVVAGGWWVALVELVPASLRPYVGGSQTNSFLELTFGYNGLGRITGDEEGSVGGGGGMGGGFGGSTGLTRLFDAENGGQITWLVPAALILAAGALWARGRAPRTDVRRAAVVGWLSLLLVTAVTFSFMAGIFHAYYTVALAAPVAALVGIGGWTLWSERHRPWALWVLAAASGTTTAWTVVLLGRSADWLPWLRWTVLAVGVLGTLALAAAALRPQLGALARAGAVLALVAGLAGPTAYTLQTVATAHTGSIVTAGPTVSSGFGGMGGGGMPGGGQMGQPPTGGQGGQTGGGQTGQPPTGGQGGQGGQMQPPTGTQGTMPGGQGQTGQDGGMGGGGGAGGGMGGLLDGADVSDEVAQLLLQDADSYTWAAAAVGSQNAASYQLETEEPVMAIGGFNGSDPSPTLEQFQEYVAAGEIHWFIGGGGFGGQNGGSSASSEIAAWVEENFTATTVDGVTLYDLTGATTQTQTSTVTSGGTADV
ncbi:ArnT family glycosyltransferase [Promicromonospora sukumoe]|uniref:ArnT family glycosyltransferase n=1 Tax=Promicromonospora sukumoe TaxID=88382 RepID=UPI00037BEB00|nr:glycosyltransferase family 39 protein [Promicromonospora sukumoe]